MLYFFFKFHVQSVSLRTTYPAKKERGDLRGINACTCLCICVYIPAVRTANQPQQTFKMIIYTWAINGFNCVNLLEILD